MRCSTGPFLTSDPILLPTWSLIIITVETMVQDSANVSFFVNRIDLEHTPLGLPITEISLKDFEFSCHRDTAIQDLNNLISRMEGRLRDIVLEAYHGSYDP
jgi:hypothetical protein